MKSPTLIRDKVGLTPSRRLGWTYENLLLRTLLKIGEVYLSNSGILTSVARTVIQRWSGRKCQKLQALSGNFVVWKYFLLCCAMHLASSCKGKISLLDHVRLGFSHALMLFTCMCQMCFACHYLVLKSVLTFPVAMFAVERSKKSQTQHKLFTPVLRHGPICLILQDLCQIGTSHFKDWS